jgi:hypothetical protein
MSVAEAQVEQLVKMAHHIALNMGAEGDAAAGKTAEHIRKFCGTALRQLATVAPPNPFSDPVDLGQARGFRPGLGYPALFSGWRRG